MLTQLLLALSIQTSLIEADAAAMLRAAVETMVPPSRVVDGMTLGERPLFIDVSGSHEAFRQAGFEQKSFSFTLPGRSFANRTELQVRGCTAATAPAAPRRECRILERGVFVSIVKVKRATSSEGPHQITLRVLFDRTWPSGDVSVVGGDHDLYLTKIDDKWVVKIGPARVT